MEADVDIQHDWQWNEIQQVGTDYADVSEVERYDERMNQLRDSSVEDAAILNRLGLVEDSSILEIGTGTGHFARHSAKAGYRVSAIDVSPVMLEYARRRAESQGLKIEFHHAGFLTMPFEPETFEAAVSVMALHHLPDAWKAIALDNVHRVLKPGGLFFLRDVVFEWDQRDHRSCFDEFVNSCGEDMRKEAARHVACEYSTLDWIMRGLLERAELSAIACESTGKGLMQYLCRKSPR